MSVPGYVRKIADAGVIRDAEKESIERSLEVLRARLREHFGEGRSAVNPIDRHFAFGSYTRGTILPRNMDPKSDVDYMIVFSDNTAKPQAYLDRLRRFVEANYPRSEVAQSSPTIVLSLNHIRFELVPAIESMWSGLQIPAKASSYSDWIDTSPNVFNDKLTAKNKENDNLIKPMVRLLKYWNACNRYPYGSFELEQLVVDHVSLEVILFGGDLWKRFTKFVTGMSASWGDPQSKKDCIERAQQIVREVERLIETKAEEQAERKLQRLLPPI